ncbi:unnamed protein product [Rhizopus stolonifer]
MSFILLALAYVLLASLFFIERRYESRRVTTTLETASDDRGTSRLLIFFYFLAIVVPPFHLFFFNTPSSSLPYTLWMGIPLMLAAMALMRWATLTNPFYLCSMSTTNDHYICTDGPYKTIRHPGYCAFLVGWIGFALMVGNWTVFLVVIVPLACIYILRIQAEEQMMLDRFGVDYQQYMYETYR